MGPHGLREMQMGFLLAMEASRSLDVPGLLRRLRISDRDIMDGSFLEKWRQMAVDCLDTLEQ